MELKAKVIATGEIVEINESCTIYDAGLCHVYNASELENIPDTDPDYWTRLEHQYAGMAMQGILSMPVYGSNGSEVDQDAVIECAMEYAHALVEKYKKEEM